MPETDRSHVRQCRFRQGAKRAGIDAKAVCQDADIVGALAFQGGRKFLVASYSGNGFVVPEDETLGTTRKGKQVLNLKAPDKAAAMTVVDGDMVATIGENRKMVIFGLDQVPEMTRGRGVRLQRYLQQGLSHVTTFKAD